MHGAKKLARSAKAWTYFNSVPISSFYLEKRTARMAAGCFATGVTKKDEFRDRIVEHLLGFRLNSQTIRRGSWSS
jgi:hypothetical protein